MRGVFSLLTIRRCRNFWLCSPRESPRQRTQTAYIRCHNPPVELQAVGWLSGQVTHGSADPSELSLLEPGQHLPKGVFGTAGQQAGGTHHLIRIEANVNSMIDVEIGQLMTEELVTVNRSETLADAGVAMTDADIKSVIVSDTESRPVGILTSTDFVRMAADETTPAASSVDEYMTHDIVTATPGTPVKEAANLMIEQGISHLPVVDEDGRLAGIITTTDVAAYVSGLSDLLP